MSAVRYFDNVPHIVRYGMHDDKEEKCWIWFWRNGVRFKIVVNREDVQGNAPFYEQWKPLLREHARGQVPLSQWADMQWHPLCDLIISTSMATLKQLAPDREHWVTLSDYLHTPAYLLRLVASGDRGEIITQIDEGPTDTSAYGLSPVQKDVLPLPTGLQYYQSKDLRVLNKDKDWRQAPKKVSAPDESTFFFLGCGQSSRDYKTKELRNYTLDHILSNLKVLETQTRAPVWTSSDCMIEVCGVVTDMSMPENYPEPSCDEGKQTSETTRGEERVAGILLQWIPKGRTLAQTVQELTGRGAVQINDNIRGWRSRIEQAIDDLHQKGMYLGERNGSKCLNEHSILIDMHGRSWLSLHNVSWASDVSAEEASKGVEVDDSALIYLFEEWLPGKIAKGLTA